MAVELLHATANMKKFMEILWQYPFAAQFWETEGDSYALDIERLKNEISSFSHGEQIMAKFLVSVFTGRQQKGLEFDLMEAAHFLSRDNLDVIREWLNDPFFP